MTSHSSSSRHHRLIVGTFVTAVVSSTLVVSAVVAPVASTAVSAAIPAWTIQSSPNPAGAAGSDLAAVSCSASGNCVAVGSANYPSSQQPTQVAALIERLADGTWRIQKTPVVSNATTSSLDGVSCPVADFCVAVGNSFPDSAALAETWNGTSWRQASLPTPVGGAEPSLAAVSCAAKARCVAVGNYIDSTTDTYRPLTERLNGRTWSVVPAPGAIGADADSEFTGVDCSVATSCEAVGNIAYNDVLQKVFAYQLTGSTWTVQRQVNPGPDPGNSDSAVSCSAPDACTSVGSAYVVQEFVLAEYWNGSSWVRQETPAPANRPDNTLYDVSCDGGSSCVAVGESWRVDPENGHLVAPQASAEVWDGTDWSLSKPAIPSGLTIGLAGISCPAPNNCVAVGFASTSRTADEGATLVEMYVG